MIGVLVPEFPSQTHIFFWREIEALRELGESVAILSTRRPPAGACRHDFAAEASEQTHYLYPPRLASVASLAIAKPARLREAARYLSGLTATSAKRKIAGAGFLACAADLRRYSAERGIDHIHVHSCADAAHVAALCRILGGPPYSLVLHGDLPVYGTDHRSKVARAKFVGAVGSHLVSQMVEEVGVDPSRVLRTFMGLDTSLFTPPGSRGGREGELKMATVARLDRCKGHRHALAAMRTAVDRGCDVTYTIAGIGPHEAEIRSEVGRLGLADRVVFPGTLGEGDVLRLLHESDVFLLPSVGQGEAWPVSLMEAMASGLPCVSSIIGATPEMIDDGTDGLLVRQADEAALAEAIVRLAQDPSLRHRIGEAARRRAVACFDRRVSSRLLLDAIRRPDRETDEIARQPDRGEAEVPLHQ